MASPNRTVVRCCESGTMAGDCRWLLEVELTDTSGPPLVVVQMNPSTANNSKSDPTVGKVESWARKNGFQTSQHGDIIPG